MFRIGSVCLDIGEPFLRFARRQSARSRFPLSLKSPVAISRCPPVGISRGYLPVEIPCRAPVLEIRDMKVPLFTEFRRFDLNSGTQISSNG